MASGKFQAFDLVAGAGKLASKPPAATLDREPFVSIAVTDREARLAGGQLGCGKAWRKGKDALE
jgi:hypothetical protein